MIVYIFIMLAVLAIASALAMVINKNVVNSALFLVINMVSLAGIYLLLNAQFLAAVHVIVYSGAIMVLFLYVIMMLNQNVISEAQKSGIAKTTAVAAGGLLMIVLVGILKSADGLEINPAGNNQIGMVETLGIALYRDFLLPFEVSALLFLTAMIGATLIGKKENTEA